MLHYLSGKRTGIYYADSTHFAVCKNIRINSNRTFNNLAKMGRINITPSRHRSPINFFTSLFSALIAYQLKPNKPCISYP
ncbi:transposase [Rickettsia monacensis]|nr:transposase [Rickettsia monacensis]CDI28920.1 hypothetical protein RMONA_1220 [Rickettsia monacensis IrR/Munich]